MYRPVQIALHQYAFSSKDAIEISDMASWLGDEHCAIRVGYGRRTATAAAGGFYFNHCCQQTICSVDTSFGGDSNQLH